jgi:hypothetical protein
MQQTASNSSASGGFASRIGAGAAKFNNTIPDPKTTFGDEAKTLSISKASKMDDDDEVNMDSDNGEDGVEINPSNRNAVSGSQKNIFDEIDNEVRMSGKENDQIVSSIHSNTDQMGLFQQVSPVKNDNGDQFARGLGSGELDEDSTMDKIHNQGDNSQINVANGPVDGQDLLTDLKDKSQSNDSSEIYNKVIRNAPTIPRAVFKTTEPYVKEQIYEKAQDLEVDLL